MTTTRTPRGGAAINDWAASPGSTRAHSGPRREAPLRIALLCPVWFPVPPPRYGGIEAVVALLADDVLEHDRTGIIVESHGELPEGIADVDRIEPAECRRAAEERFSPGVLVDGYVRAFRAAIELAGGSASSNAAAAAVSAGHV